MAAWAVVAYALYGLDVRRFDEQFTDKIVCKIVSVCGRSERIKRCLLMASFFAIVLYILIIFWTLLFASISGAVLEWGPSTEFHSVEFLSIIARVIADQFLNLKPPPCIRWLLAFTKYDSFWLAFMSSEAVNQRSFGVY